MTLTPIETNYNGHRFRSRLEARWAVFFDALGVNYEYESDGYDLGEGDWYLPDFKITAGFGQAFVEIKPRVDKDDIWSSITPEVARKADKLAVKSKTPVLVVAGDPRIIHNTEAGYNFYHHQYRIAYYAGCWAHLPFHEAFVGLSASHILGLLEYLTGCDLDTSWFDGSYQDIRRLLDIDRDRHRENHPNAHHVLWGHCGVTTPAVFDCFSSKLQSSRHLKLSFNFTARGENNINLDLLNAFEKASTARFEHGETPAF